MTSPSDLSPGTRIGTRTIVAGPEYRPVGKQGQYALYCRTRCDCGAEAWTQLQALEGGRAGSCRSCGQRRRREREGPRCVSTTTKARVE